MLVSDQMPFDICLDQQFITLCHMMIPNLKQNILSKLNKNKYRINYKKKKLFF
jgi:hypothetical protein